MLIPNLKTKTKFKKSTIKKLFKKTIKKAVGLELQYIVRCPWTVIVRGCTCTWLFQSAAGLSTDSNSPQQVHPRTVIVHGRYVRYAADSNSSLQRQKYF